MWDFKVRVIGRVRMTVVQEVLREACLMMGGRDHHEAKEVVIVGLAAPHETNTQKARKAWAKTINPADLYIRLAN
jgi:hypothetical protein